MKKLESNIDKIKSIWNYSIGSNYEIIQKTYEEKVKMYMNIPIGELIEMIIEANNIIDKLIKERDE